MRCLAQVLVWLNRGAIVVPGDKLQFDAALKPTQAELSSHVSDAERIKLKDLPMTRQLRAPGLLAAPV